MCSTCGSIGPRASANTGRDEYFGPPVTSLKRHDLDSQRDLRECTECGAFFYHEEYVAQTGSGNNDEDTINRLSDADSAVASQLLHDRIDDSRSVARGLLSADAAVRDLLGGRAGRLLPAIIAELPAASPADHEWGVRLVTSHVERSSERRAEVMALLANEPSNPTIDLLRALSRRSGCTVCSPIEVYPETAAQRDSLAGLRSLGLGAQRDLLECPSCESLFRWESADGIGGSISRVPDLVYFALRACVHPAGAISRYAMSAVYNFGETWAQLMFRHALHQDRELLRPFLADMEKAVKRQPDHWLRAFLDELTDANTP